MSTSLSFVGSSQQLWMRPKFVGVDGTTERPRLCVFLSNKHLYVQMIDNTKMHTLASASTMQKPISEEFNFTSGPTIVAFRAKIRKGYQLPHKGIIPEEFGGISSKQKTTPNYASDDGYTLSSEAI